MRKVGVPYKVCYEFRCTMTCLLPDPEEFLNLLFKHILNVEPFVHIK